MQRKKTYLTTISGLVQGVGFRPFIYRLANEFGIRGWVNNTNENVQICLNADPELLESFVRAIRDQAPPVSRIESIGSDEVAYEEFSEFRIIESESRSDSITEVSPDIAVCTDCLEDMHRQANRIGYPFLNCTNCGPRFTIVRDLPYDRAQTTMQVFTMCDSCREEYGNIMDRRFHAQPTACRDCGPQYSLVGTSKSIQADEAIERTAAVLNEGGIVAVKGLGGFFMACDAMNQDAVKKLRDSKHREGKPFAVMFSSTEAIRKYCELKEAEAIQLESWRRPIVILRNRSVEGRGPEAIELAPSVSNGFPTTGVMLPYMPFHHLLFQKLKTEAIVLTSGNLAEEPIIIDNKKAEEVLDPVSDAILHYNRDIYNRCDDSVAMAMNGTSRLLRRSRGFVPTPVRTGLDTEGIFAAGAELVNCFAMGKGKQAILSQHIGDLKNFETFEFYTETYERFERLFRLKPVLAAHDLHPDYLSTRFAKDLGLQSVKVQHHHAHIASVLAEHRLDEKVIGVSFDGTGLGDDGNIWGSEFMVCDLEGYKRMAYLDYLPMPGGDRSTYEPWRLAVSCLYKLHGRDLKKLNLPFLEAVDPTALDMVIQSIEKNVNSPLSSGAGRLFDAASAMLNLCTTASFHAEAPMRLEAAIRRDKGSYPFDIPGSLNAEKGVGTGKIIKGMMEDLESGTDPGIISARFHNSIAGIIIDTVAGINHETGIRKVALSGGTFQNRYLSEKVENQLKEKGFEVLVPLQLPTNDGGIALGQLAIAAKLRQLGKV